MSSTAGCIWFLLLPFGIFCDWWGRYVPMPGVDFGEFADGLAEAFSLADLRRLLRVRLNVDMEREFSSGSTDEIAFEIVDWAEKRSREAELAGAVYRERPNNPKLRLVYEKYGMAPAASVQASGQSTRNGLLRTTTAAFEATVKPKLKTVDIAVWRERLARIEGQVCRIEFNNNPNGTGFLIGPDLVLTNYHVMEMPLKGELPPSQVGCRFDYKVLSDNSRSEGTVVRLDADNWRVDASPYSKAEADGQPDREPPTADELDFALLRLARPVGSEAIEKNGTGAPKRGWVGMPADQPSIKKDMPLIIAQHPDGSPMKLAFDTDGVIGMAGDGRRVRYATNTEPGSSGSPCFDIDWNLIALHHLGDDAWKRVPNFNQGIPIGLIGQRLGDKIEREST